MPCTEPTGSSMLKQSKEKGKFNPYEISSHIFRIDHSLAALKHEIEVSILQIEKE
jgi:hypothetical protein